MTNTFEIEIIDFSAEQTQSTRRAWPPAKSVIFGDTAVNLASFRQDSILEGVSQSRRVSIPADDQLCVVTQKGRIFQNENPEIEVVLDRGRYLLVQIPPSKSHLIAEHTAPCYSIEPADQADVVYEKLRRPPTVESVSDGVPEQLDELDLGTFESVISALTAIPTRFSTQEGFKSAITHCQAVFENIGYRCENRQVDVPGFGASQNLLARVPDAIDPPKILVTAHLDSINGPGGPSANAPGADDNASGSAGVLTLAEAMFGTKAAEETMFVLFGGEEQGLHGSKQFVASGNDFDAAALKAVINMDMIGSINAASSGSEPTLSVLLEGGEISRTIIDGLAAAAHRHTPLEVSRSFNPHNSDHEPFILAGIPAVLTIEGEDGNNRFVHTGNDRLEHINPELAMAILRMNMGFVVETLDTTAVS